MSKRTVVLGVIGADVHAVGNQILRYALKQAGFEVANVGVMASQKELVEAALETDADAIWVSSLYGHAEMDSRGLRDKCREAGIGDILIYIGGNLVIGKQNWPKVKKKFEDIGFDRAYPPDTSPQRGIDDLKKDLKKRK